MEDSFWLINSDRSGVKRFSKNKQNKDQFFEYMFIDSGKIVGVLGNEPPVLTTREELKFPAAVTPILFFENIKVKLVIALTSQVFISP